MLLLTTENVRSILFDCFAGDEKNPHIKIVEGITKVFALDSEKLENHKSEIIQLLSQLPLNFRESVGGGWSFLEACIRNDGYLWGQHINMEELFVLGMGVGKVECMLPRELLVALPGGVPYYVIKDKDLEG